MNRIDRSPYAQASLSLIRREAAFTIIEVVFASAIVAVFMAGVALINSNVLSLLRAQREQTSASLCLQERVEQIRSLTFAQLIDSNYIKTNVLNAGTAEEGNLSGLTETLTVSAYPTQTPTNPNFVITRSAGAAGTPSVTGTLVSTQLLVRVDLSFQWTSRSGRQQTRQVSTVVANGGLNSA